MYSSPQCIYIITSFCRFANTNFVGKRKSRAPEAPSPFYKISTSFFRGEMVYYFHMKLTQKTWMRSIALVAAVVVTLLSLLAWLLFRSQGKLAAGVALPRVSPTPQATPSPAPAQIMVTAAPTPKLVQVARQYPPGALDLVADGRVLFTVESVQAAQQILAQYLQENARQGLGPDERLIRAGFDQKLSLEEPSGRGELLNVSEAVNTLNADEGLLPVVRTVVRCVIERGERESSARVNAQLLTGSRIYRNVGVYPYTLSYYETKYRGQAAFSEVKTNEFAVGPGRVDVLTEDGGCIVGEASPTTGPAKVQVAGFQPQWPVSSGTVTGFFGMTDEGMSYGVEITAESVARVVAPEEGVIIYCSQRGSLGLVIDILHDETGCISRIIGCQRSLVELYQRVKKGEQVGALPDPASGRMTTLHYELLLDGIPVNPQKYLSKR